MVNSKKLISGPSFSILSQSMQDGPLSSVKIFQNGDPLFKVQLQFKVCLTGRDLPGTKEKFLSNVLVQWTNFKSPDPKLLLKQYCVYSYFVIYLNPNCSQDVKFRISFPSTKYVNPNKKFKRGYVTYKENNSKYRLVSVRL